ncbi:MULTISPECIES: hypothetical protein [unclassified Streptomyces]|uniref:hypothetical protein n=1 Tax=unclassified Streptomyces TaxID=2593676 RepID=UPI002E2821ED|nr:hypothetical protein [Streptomyces sp. NBC_01439]
MGQRAAYAPATHARATAIKVTNSRLTRAWTDTATTSTRPGPSVPGIGGCSNTEPQTGQIGGPAPYRRSFTYDVTGNRTSSTDHDPAGDASSNTVTRKDAVGSPQSLTWSPEGKLESAATATGTSTYLYDAEGTGEDHPLPRHDRTHPQHPYDYGHNASGTLRQYQTMYAHADGRTTTQSWGTFDVHTWQGHKFSSESQNQIKLEVTICGQMGTCR